MYARELDGKTLTFTPSGQLLMNSLTMNDKETGSLWSHLLGEAVEGPLKGRRLEVTTSQQVSWANWRRQHPDSMVWRHGRTSLDDPARAYYESQIAGSQGRAHHDDRLPAKERVLGLRVGGQAKAYTFKALDRAGVLDDQVAGVPVVIVFQAASESGAVHRRVLGDRVLHFRRGPEPLVMADDETGSVWDGLAGRAVSGPLAGSRLEKVPITYSFWFGWADFYPGSPLYR